MTLDESIKHAEEVAEAQEEKCKHAGHDHYTKLEASACAAEHRQLAEWLKELKKLREQKWPHGKWVDYEDENYPNLANCSNCGYQMDTHNEHGYFNFCPNCGSDNRKRGKEQ